MASWITSPETKAWAIGLLVGVVLGIALVAVLRG